MFWAFFKFLFFRLDAEFVHRLTVFFVRVLRKLGRRPLLILSGASSPLRSLNENSLPRVWDISFQSRLGLAAGFDKNAELVDALPFLGFGFAEIGTVTPCPQPGNKPPRLFRDPSKKALFNCMGFNNLGAEAIAQRLARARTNLPQCFRVGVNIGKNKETLLEDAPKDYILAARAFEGLADYLVINVSSPNTPGLRGLQTVTALRPIVNGVQEVISAWARKPPLVVKLAPEIQGEQLFETLRAGESWGIDGWILTNTLAGSFRSGDTEVTGGYSGMPLEAISRARLQEARTVTQLPIISVGGIMSADEARKRRELGADLVQIYSGWIFNGPSFPAEISSILQKNR